MKAALLLTGMAGAAIAGGLAHAAMAPAAIDAATDDARRAAAARLLDASHFRERQRIVLSEGIRAAQTDLADACIDRAATGRDLSVCGATGHASAVVRARLAARQSDMLDEIMAASERVYAQQFTAQEMDEVTRFFRSPTGQKYAARFPMVIDQVGAARRPILRRYLVAAASPGIPRP